MKTLNLYILLLIILALNTKAHDYQTAYSNRVVLFENYSNKILGLRIDSVQITTDTIFYPFTTIQEVIPNECISPYKASWIGDKVVIKPDGTNLFFNREGDTITLKTSAAVNEQWIAYSSAEAFFVEAKVLGIELIDFLGFSDSVKTIGFRVVDREGNTLDHALNKLNVKISKTYGFVETLNFYLFPDIFVRIPTDYLMKYTLVGLTNPEVGVQNLNWIDIYNFNIGDELHIHELKEGDPYFYLPIRKYDNRCLYKYIERIDYADSIVYRYTRKQSIETVYTDSTTFETYNDTLKSVIVSNPAFDKLPGEPTINSRSAYSFYMRDDEFLKKIDQSGTRRFVLGENCWSLFVGEGCVYDKSYYEGLGGPYYSCKGYAGDSEERKLAYYKKGETEWGEKLVITSTQIKTTKGELKVFPNPADKQVTIINPLNIKIKKIELVDISGRIVHRWEELRPGNNVLVLNSILPGIYFLKAKTVHGVITEKLIVQ